MDNWSISPDVIACNAALTACAACSWRLVLQLLGSFPSRRLTPDVVSFSVAASACRSTQWQEALSCLQGAVDGALAPDATLWSATITACGDAGEWQRALELFASSRRVADAGLFAAAVRACQVGVQWQLALLVLREMRLAGASGPKLEKGTKDVRDDRLVAFGAALSAAERRNWLWALHLAEALGQEGLCQNVITRSTAVSAWGRGYRWQEALTFLHGAGRESVQANVFTYTAASSAAEKAQRWRMAQQLLCVVGCQNVEPNVQAFSALCSAWAENGSWRQAAALVQAMQTAGPQPNQFTYNGLARACQRGDSWTHALRLFATLDEGRDGVQPDLLTLDASIKAFERGGQTWLLPPLTRALTSVKAADGNQESLVLELLGHALSSTQAAAFARKRVAPVLRRLRGCLGSGSRDDVLAAQFGLGELFTSHVLEEASLSAHTGMSGPAWLPGARHPVRSRGENSPSEPRAQELAASIAMWSEKAQARCRAFGHGGSRRYEDMKLLTQVYVEHDRLWHSERHALLALLSQLLISTFAPQGSTKHASPLSDQHNKQETDSPGKMVTCSRPTPAAAAACPHINVVMADDEEDYAAAGNRELFEKLLENLQREGDLLSRKLYDYADADYSGDVSSEEVLAVLSRLAAELGLPEEAIQSLSVAAPELEAEEQRRRWSDSLQQLCAEAGATKFKEKVRELLHGPLPGEPRIILGPVIGKVTESSARILVEASHDVDNFSCACNAEGSSSAATAKMTLKARRPSVVKLDGLAPSTLYSVEVQGAKLLVDRCSFRTLPAGGWRLGDGRPPCFAVASCNCVYENRKRGASREDLWAELKSRLESGFPVDYMLHLGDNVYLDSDLHLVEKGKKRLEDWDDCKWGVARDWLTKMDDPSKWSEHEKEIEEHFRNVYRETWGHRPTRWVLANVPNLMILDDHDIRDDWGDRPEDKDEKSVDRFLADIAYRVYNSYQRLLYEDPEMQPDGRSCAPKCDHHMHAFGDVGLLFVDVRGCKTFHWNPSEDIAVPMLGQAQWSAIQHELAEGSAGRNCFDLI
ncbi:unnamed protein product [Symbiodinium natans]|uniref:PhoD-like phosphatase metallophosphatase domain-containing protein n=1 Tax=Symbiodinium natans TaxID=878477 RepID=A0A812N225_9DINO|nr:unnamed protein product [Symbiodinium natans]